MEERCNVVLFPPIAQQPSSGIKNRLQAIQETLRRANEQTVAAIDLRSDEDCNCRSRCLERQRFDAAFQETKLTEAAWNDLPVELRSLLMARPSKFYISLNPLNPSVPGVSAL